MSKTITNLTSDVTARVMKAMYYIISTSKTVTNQKEFAEAIGTVEYRISKFKSGDLHPTTENLQTLLATFPISAEWLMRGTGSMVLHPQDDPLKAVEFIVGELKRLRAEVNRLKSEQKPGTMRSKRVKSDQIRSKQILKTKQLHRQTR